MKEYTLSPARYSKGKTAIHCPSPDGFKTRAARLAERLSNGRYSGREESYILSHAAARRFADLYEEGWDASPITGKFIEPVDPKENNE